MKPLGVAWMLFLLSGLAMAAPAPKYYFGADLSYVNELEDCGAVFTEHGQRRDVFELLHSRGANLVRVRLWNDARWTRYSNLADVKKTIRRARSAGMQVLLDYHYSDDWADGDKQIVPRAWAAITDQDALAAKLYEFTYRSLLELDRSGLMPELVQVGNETNGEILSTLERAKQPIDWARNAKLLNAGIRAVRDAGAKASIKPRVMLHIAQPENVEPWFAAANAAGVTDFDLIGISYYRRWSTQNLDGLAAVIERLRHRYPADVMVVEAAYPWTLDGADDSPNLLGESTLVADYPATRSGQRRYLIELAQRVIDSGGVGLVYWEPAWIATKCKTRWGTGSGWENAALFDFKGELLPGADFFGFPYIYPSDGTRRFNGSKSSDANVAASGTGNFNADWRFHRFESPPDSQRLDGIAESAWEQVTLPHTARIEPRIVNDQWQGIAVYRKRFAADPAWRGNRLWLRFDGAMNIARVQFNGRDVATHLGGYLPFVVDLTRGMRADTDNEVVVWLDNRDSAITGPKPLKVLDFNTYGGLYRDVTLIVKEPLHITDEIMEGRPASGGVFVSYPRVTAESAEIAVQTHIRNSARSPAKFRVLQTLLDQGRVVASSTSPEMSLRAGADIENRLGLVVDRPQLWSPRTPHLYELVTVVEADGHAIDGRRTRIGIRHIELSPGEFRINGERMYLRGVNRHQEYPYVGYALSRRAEFRDAKRIKEAGFDFVRLSHYPQSPDFMAAADELGLVLLDSILGWQFYNSDPAFERQVLQTCRDLIRRDRNHPSVIAWECSLNETRMPVELVRKFHAVVKQEYPGSQGISAGWQNDGYDVYLQARQHRIEHYEPPDRPYLVSEYGDWEYYALNAGFRQHEWTNLLQAERSSRQLLGDGEARLLQQAANIQEAHNDNFTTPAFADAYWAMFDYNRGYADDLEASGVMSLDRVAKFSYRFFRSQRDAKEISPAYESGPGVFIASYWQPQSSTDVRVFGNVDEVELFLNGVRVGRQRPDADRVSQHLRHAPFTFRVPQFAAGTLDAVGYIGGKAVANGHRRSPGAYAHSTFLRLSRFQFHCPDAEDAFRGAASPRLHGDRELHCPRYAG